MTSESHKSISQAMLHSRPADPWSDWQCGVVAALHDRLRDVVGSISAEDVDWEAWRPLYEEGRSPGSAVEQASLGYAPPDEREAERGCC